MASRTRRTRSATTEINPMTPAGAWDPQDPVHGVAAAAVVNMVLRVAGPAPTRVDQRNAGTPERQLGISLGAVLVFLRSLYTARSIEQAWSQAAPLATSLPPVLVGRRRGVLAQDGPWSATAIVRLGGAPKVRGYLLEARVGSEAPSVLRIEVGPMTWEIYDALSTPRCCRAGGPLSTICAPRSPRRADCGQVAPAAGASGAISQAHRHG